MPRHRYLDLLRVVSIGMVVIGHWLLTNITYRNGTLSGADAMTYVSWSGWATLLFQVMPVFFVVGGYVNAISWSAHHELGEIWTVWVRERAMRLLWPTTVFVALATAVALAVSSLTGVAPSVLAQAAWLVALQLWFLPVYLALIMLTPLMLAAHRRWGCSSPPRWPWRLPPSTRAYSAQACQ